MNARSRLRCGCPRQGMKSAGSAKSRTEGSAQRQLIPASGHRRRHVGPQGALLVGGGGARGGQAVADALRRRQKAKKAATVKRHSLFKAKEKLLRELQDEKEEKEVVVAPEFATDFAEDNDLDAAALFSNTRILGRSEDRGIPRDDGEDNVRTPAVLLSSPIETKAARGPTMNRAGVEGCRPVASCVAEKKSGYSGKKELAPGKVQNRKEEKKLFQPFQKELAHAAARRAEKVRIQDFERLWIGISLLFWGD